MKKITLKKYKKLRDDIRSTTGKIYYLFQDEDFGRDDIGGEYAADYFKDAIQKAIRDFEEEFMSNYMDDL